MIGFRNVLCPIDFSDCSQSALRLAGAIARRYGSTLTVLHVFPTIPSVVYRGRQARRDPIELTTDDRNAIFEHVRHFLRDHVEHLPPFDIVVREGEPSREILRFSDEIGADLLVLGTHGRRGFERLVLGSVAERLLRTASCPTLIVPRLETDRRPGHSILFDNIVCPVDFSDCSLHAFDYARSLATEAGTSVTALHITTGAAEGRTDAGDAALVNERLHTAELETRRAGEARRKLQALIRRHESDRCRVDAALVRGTPGPAIVRFAAAHGNDLTVMGVHGRSTEDLMFFGSTTQHVVREAPCPVLTIRRR